MDLKDNVFNSGNENTQKKTNLRTSENSSSMKTYNCASVKVSFDNATNSVRVKEGNNPPELIPITANGLSIERSNNQLNIGAISISNPFSELIFNISSKIRPLIDWDDSDGNMVIGTTDVSQGKYFIGLDQRKGNLGVKIKLTDTTFTVEHGKITANVG